MSDRELVITCICCNEEQLSVRRASICEDWVRLTAKGEVVFLNTADLGKVIDKLVDLQSRIEAG